MTRQEQINKLNEQLRELRIKVSSLEQAEANEVSRPLLRKSVGKCFIYSNSYGTGERWPVYAKIVSFNERDVNFNTIQFQHTITKRVEIEYEVAHNWEGKNHFREGSGWTEISVAEYNRARRSAMKFITRLLGDGGKK